MKLYGGRFLRNNTARQVDRRTESRDAELYDIDYQNRRCRCKVQGTATLVIAHFPENWESTPAWLKPGNSVRISHTGGNRGRVELIGHGALVVSPVTGDVGAPTIPTVDAIMSGLNVVALDHGRLVGVNVGTVRISGVTSAVDVMTLSESSVLVLDLNATLDQLAAAFEVPGAPGAGLYRYDLIVIGTDKVIDYVTGSASAAPVMPAVPSGHLLCGRIFVPGGITAIAQSNVNGSYVAPTATSLTMAIADDDLAWAELTTTVTCTVQDQYGRTLAGGWYVSLAIINGNGTISHGGTIYTTSGVAAFTYTRGQTAGDLSPMLQATVQDTALTAYGPIILRDNSGNPM